MCLKETHRQP